MKGNINDEIKKMGFQIRQTSNDNNEDPGFVVKCGSRIQSIGSLVGLKAANLVMLWSRKEQKQPQACYTVSSGDPGAWGGDQEISETDRVREEAQDLRLEGVPEQGEAGGAPPTRLGNLSLNFDYWKFIFINF